ncbi:MAG: SoxR reducing system RseC family protein [Anaerohalosphaeraceae bacterium]|nr:SoxR reducing system RseC family protein [Anaerohalosphaeraceae bacterium]
MEQHCKSCNHQNDCEEIYSRLCNTESPSVLRGVVEVFLVPLVLFVGTIVLAESFLPVAFASELLRVLIMVAAAVVILSVYITLLKMWRYKNQK